MKQMIREIDRFIDKYNKPLTHEQIIAVIYNAFCMIIFLLPIIPEIIGVGLYSLKNTLFNLTTVIVSITLIVLNIRKTRKLKLNIYDILLIIYLMLVTLSTIFAKYGVVDAILGLNGRGEGLVTIFSYAATFLIFLRGYKYMAKTVRMSLIAALIVCIYSIVQATLPLDIELPFANRKAFGIATGTMRNQNFLSSYICIFLPAMCYYYINTKSHKSLIIVAMLFMAQVFSVTLGGYATFIVIYILVAIFSMYFSKSIKNTLFRIMVLTLVIICVFFGLKCINGDVYSNELSQTSKEVKNLVNKSDSFGTGRLAIWKRVVMAVENNALLGVGPDSLKLELFDTKYHLNGEVDVLGSVIVDKAHCEYLHIAVTTGIPSLIVYLIFIATILIRLFRIVIINNKQDINRKSTLFTTVIFISLVSYLGQAIGNISVVQVAPVFWGMLGIGAGLTLAYRKYSKRKI